MTRGEKITNLLENGYSDDEIAEIADEWARDNSSSLEDETAKYLGFVAGFKEGYGFGVQDGADLE